MRGRLTKTRLLLGLRKVRQTLEAETGGLTESQALLLTDICRALGMCDSETYYVVGDAFAWFVDVPISYRINGNGLGPPIAAGRAPGSPNVGDVATTAAGIERPQRVVA